MSNRKKPTNGKSLGWCIGIGILASFIFFFVMWIPFIIFNNAILYTIFNAVRIIGSMVLLVLVPVVLYATKGPKKK